MGSGGLSWGLTSGACWTVTGRWNGMEYYYQSVKAVCVFCLRYMNMSLYWLVLQNIFHTVINWREKLGNAGKGLQSKGLLLQ